jgi:hypothetical protein
MHVEIPDEARALIERNRRLRIRQTAVLHWMAGRSVAGIQIEIQEQYGITLPPRRILNEITRARRQNPSIPKALQPPARDPLDTRADLCAVWQAEKISHTLASMAEHERED